MNRLWLSVAMAGSAMMALSACSDTDTSTSGRAPVSSGPGSAYSTGSPMRSDPAAVDATRQNSQTMAPGTVRQGTSVPMTGGGAR